MAPDDYFRVIFGLVAVIGLIGVAALIARKAGVVSMPAVAGRKRRLAIAETLPLDARRRLMIVRCDDREHLIILGAQSETIVDTGFDAAVVEDADETPGRNPFAELRSAFNKTKSPEKDKDRDAA